MCKLHVDSQKLHTEEQNSVMISKDVLRLLVNCAETCEYARNSRKNVSELGKMREIEQD